MSGGVGPSSDIHLPKEEHQHHQQEEPPQQPKPADAGAGSRSHHQQNYRFPSLRHLNCLAIIVVLAASGLVTLEDFTVVVLSTIYIFFLSKFSFPVLSPHQQTPIFAGSRILPVYILLAAAAGLIFPIFYIFAGIYNGDKEGIRAAAPHLFLLASQVVMEGVSASSRFSVPVRVFVPVFYNSWRLPVIVEWLRRELVAPERGGSERMVLVGRALALVNLGLWSFNLFGFLLPVYLPRAFKRYYSHGDTATGPKVQ